MKKKVVFILSAIALLIQITACGGASTQTIPGSTENSGETSLSQANNLLVGTLKLEDSDQAVSAEQVVTLLPLWQAYRSLSTSQTAADAEVDALLNQIENTMTAEQVQAIGAMNLTSTDMMSLMQSLGGMRMTRGTPDPQSTPGFDFPPGGFEGGGPPAGDFQAGGGEPPSGSSAGPSRNFGSGGGVVVGEGPLLESGGDAVLGTGPMLQGTPDPSMQATAQARFSTQADQVNSILLDVLINKLEAKSVN